MYRNEDEFVRGQKIKLAICFGIIALDLMLNWLF
jgi:hypothetical protein